MPIERSEIQAKRDEIANGAKCQRCFQDQAHQGVGVSLHHRILAHTNVAASLQGPLSTASNFDNSWLVGLPEKLDLGRGRIEQAHGLASNLGEGFTERWRITGDRLCCG
jgi:hypothetical protein